MVTHSGEGCSSCSICGVATCITQDGVRSMQPHSVFGEQYRTIQFVATVDCTWIANTPELDLHPDSQDKAEQKLIVNFLTLLYKIGLPRLATAYLEQIQNGISPYEIELPTTLPRTEKLTSPLPNGITACMSLEQLDEIVGQESEARLNNLLVDRDNFPWVKEVIVAPANNPGYDFTLIIDTAHPIGKMLKATQIYVDAKSSTGYVEEYFEKNVRRQSEGAIQSFVIGKRRWVINSNIEKTDEEIYAQFATYILIATGKLNKPKLWDQVLLELPERVRVAFYAEQGVVLEYARIVMQSLLSQDTIEALISGNERDDIKNQPYFEVVRPSQMVTVR